MEARHPRLGRRTGTGGVTALTGTSPFVYMGILFPESILHSGLFAVLAAFVAINTLMYSALAVAKILPKVYPADWITSRNRRIEARSIHRDSSRQVVGRGGQRRRRRSTTPSRDSPEHPR